MSEIDLVKAGRLAVFTALKAAIPGVLDVVLQDTPPPFTMIGDVDFTNEGSKDDPLLLVEIEVISIYRGKDREILLGMMHAARTALLDDAVTADDSSIGDFRLLGGSASGAGPDGTTYAGLQSFQFYIQPA